MKNKLRLVLQLIDIKDELEEVGEEELKEKINDVIKDLEDE